jgi:MEDS: MEthanogen/methylotroph, DcmR Sensory domain
VQDQGLWKRIADLTGRLSVLVGESTAQRPDHPALSEARSSTGVDVSTQGLIAELVDVVDRLQRHVDRLHSADRGGSIGSQPADTASEAGGHGVHFSRSQDHTIAAIIDMVDDARAQGRAAVVVATDAHRQSLEADLHQRCIAFEGDMCRLLDAETTLSSLLVDGQPDRDRFRSVVGTLLSDVCARNPGGVSVYGEMVGLLWSQGNATAAMHLEQLWDDLQRELPFSLLCGYFIDGNPDSPDLDPIRHVHSYVG